ncbi:hypothetical protein KL944_001555 [Ogataea haglerorum]|nr:hypothetical protein KL944_001555 [Ogataea haglerorum]
MAIRDSRPSTEEPLVNSFDLRSAGQHAEFLRTRNEYRGLAGSDTQSASTHLDTLIHRPSPLVWGLTALASISGFMFGYDTGYISSVLVTIGSDLDGRELLVSEKEWITSGTSLGAVVACVFAGYIADLYGRKLVIILCNVLFVVGALLQLLATKVVTMIAGRLIMGLGVGIGSLIAPLYISELSPAKFRGRMVIINCLAITGGQLVAYAIGAILGGYHGGWRAIVGISMLPSTIQLIAFVFLPDTPRYLISIGNNKAAHQVLRKVYLGCPSELIEASIAEIHMLNAAVPGKTQLERLKNCASQLFNTPSNQRALVIGCGLQAIQQLVGINSLMYFSGTIFKMAGYTNSTAVSCFVAGTNFLFTIVAFLVIDKVGKRRILLVSIPFLIGAQILCAVAFLHFDVKVQQEDLGIWEWSILLGLVLFVAFYAVGLGNVPWQQAELFPQSVRGMGTSLATVTNWTGSLVVSACFLSLMQWLSPAGAFFVFAGITFASWVFIFLVYPELGSLQLEEVQELLKDGFNVRKSIYIHQHRLV